MFPLDYYLCNGCLERKINYMFPLNLILNLCYDCQGRKNNLWWLLDTAFVELTIQLMTAWPLYPACGIIHVYKSKTPIV